MLQRCNELSICQQGGRTRKTGTLLAAAWNCETQTLAAAAPGTRRDRPDAQELGNADRGRGGWRRGADQADPSSKPIRETLKIFWDHPTPHGI